MELGTGKQSHYRSHQTDRKSLQKQRRKQQAADLQVGSDLMQRPFQALQRFNLSAYSRRPFTTATDNGMRRVSAYPCRQKERDGRHCCCTAHKHKEHEAIALSPVIHHKVDCDWANAGSGQRGHLYRTHGCAAASTFR
ncbi:hypothetical protein D3C76_956930 [compost metagenome]